MSALFSSEAVTLAALWTIVWQSTLWLVAGLLVSTWWRERASRAHLVLLGCLVAAVVSPLLSITAGVMQWGMLPPVQVVAAEEMDLPAAKLPADAALALPATAPVMVVPHTERPAANEQALSHVNVPTQPDVIAEKAPAPGAFITARAFPAAWAFVLAAVVTWSIVSLVMAARLLRNWLGAVMLLREAEPFEDDALHQQLVRSARTMGVRPPRLAMSSSCRCPMIWCWGRQPVLFVPRDAAAQQELAWDAIFCHELAHLVRRDHVSDLCGELAIIALPWQPLVWVARSRMSAYGEQACDDWVLARGNDATDYAESLLALVPQGSGSPALAAVTDRTSLVYRIQRLLTDRVCMPTAGRRWSAAMTAITLLATCGVALAQRSAPQQLAKADAKPGLEQIRPSADVTVIAGKVVDEAGRPVAGAHVAIIGTRIKSVRGGDLNGHPTEAFAAEKSDSQGGFQLSFPAFAPGSAELESVVALAPGYALAWQAIESESPKPKESLQLVKEQPIVAKLIDSDGTPASNIRLQVRSVMVAPKETPPSYARAGAYFNGPNAPAAWPREVVSDASGAVTILGLAPGHGAYVSVAPTARVARQELAINTGMAETRGPRDGTYRPSIVKNLKPGEVGTLVLAPAQPVGGAVTEEDTGKPIDGGRVTVYAGDQKFGSQVGTAGEITGGRYLVEPNPGINFRVTAYPPDGSPYLTRQRQFDWESNEKSAKIDIALPRGVLVRGQVINERTKEPIAGATVQYIPQGERDYLDEDELITGWQGIQVSDEHGQFSMAVFPGPGHMLVQAPESEYVRHEMGGKELHNGKAGGQRNYAHAIQKIDSPRDSEPVDLTVELTPAAEVKGVVVDEQGQPVDKFLMISRLNASRHDTTWRGHTQPTLGGKFTVAGWKEDAACPVSFLDSKRKLGATVELGASDAGREVRVELKPCGAATARFVDASGKPVADYEPTVHMVVTPGPQSHSVEDREGSSLTADTDYISNIDRANHQGFPASDDQGHIKVEALIPGATYRFFTYAKGRAVVLKEFVAEANLTLDLGDVAVPERPEK